MMKHSVWALLRIDLRRGVYAFRRQKTAVKVLLAIGVPLAAVWVLAVLLGYDVLMYQGFAALGRPELLLTLMMLAGSVVTLLFTLWRGPQALFQGRDLPGLLSLPIPTRSIAAARLLRLYLSDLGFLALTLLPALGVLLVMGDAGGALAARTVAAVLVLPAVPLALGCVLGTAIQFAASRFRHSSIVSLVLSLALVVGVMALSWVNPMALDYAALGAAVERQLCTAYPPALLWHRGVVLGEGLPFAAFLVLSVGLMAGFSVLFGRWMKPLYHRLGARRGGHRRYARAALRQQGLDRALMGKELRRLMSSSVYLLNVGIGALLLMIGAVALCFIPGETILAALAEQALPPEVLSIVAPYALSFCSMMTLSSSVSLSLEGRQLWLVKSLPIPPAALLWSKTAVNLLLAVPPAALCAGVLWWKLGLGPADGLALVLLPVLFAAMISFAGTVCNLLLPRFDWQSEAQVVKRGGSLLIAMLMGFAALILAGVMHAVLSIWAAAAVLAVLTAAFAAVLFAWGARRFQTL